MRAGFGLVFGTAVLAASAAASSAQEATLTVPVRIYDNVGLDAHTLDAALSAAGVTLAGARVTPLWRECPAARHDLCGDPLAARELALRIVAAPVPRGYAGRLPLGDSLIERNTRTGVLATIYYDRVEWLARASVVTVDSLLGRAIAHEIGHLMMASSRHDDAGLMRALWTREDLQRNRARDWIFSRQDADAIRRRAWLAEAPRPTRSLRRSPSSSSAAGGSVAEWSGTLPLQ